MPLASLCRVFCALLFFGPATSFADVWTGKRIAVEGPVSECSHPVDQVPMGADLQIVSRFSYLACTEYHIDDVGVVNRLEWAWDGEYVRLVARPGEMSIRDHDYALGVAQAISTCEHVRTELTRALLPISQTDCHDQKVP